jgi:hypothetical protein
VASIKVTIPVGAGSVTITGDDPADFVRAYGSFGNADVIVGQLAEAVSRFETDNAVAVIERAFTADQASAPAVVQAEAADPWARPSASPQAAQAAPRTSASASPARPPATAQGAPVQQGGMTQAQGGVIVVDTPKGQQVWTLNPANGPVCDCGVPAAHVRAPKKDGTGVYNAYRCALGAGPNWKSKCEFNQWA